ncbi:MAG: signal peptidase I [Crenarchaeota archaeon]|nr:signal peptidase I [Thermoproteota archaeon]
MKSERAKREALEWIKAIVEAVIILTILKFVLNTGVPLAAVASGSMLPTLERGDLVVVRGAGPEDIKVGDIVVYQSCQGPLIIHRVIKIVKMDNEYYYVTKGDNNPDSDFFLGQFVDCRTGRPLPGIPYSRVEGVVVSAWGHVLKVPYLGYVALLAFPFLWWVSR